jgi:hypothetical protein
LKEIRMNDESDVVSRQSQRTSAQRMYSAKIVGGEPRPMTVTMYKGDDTEGVSAHETPHALLER